MEWTWTDHLTTQPRDAVTDTLTLTPQAEDPSIFWFGNSYRASCEGRGEYLADCYNPRREEADSLVTRLFSQTELDPDILDRYMEVTYTTKPRRLAVWTATWRSPSQVG